MPGNIIILVFACIFMLYIGIVTTTLLHVGQYCFMQITYINQIIYLYYLWIFVYASDSHAKQLYKIDNNDLHIYT